MKKNKITLTIAVIGTLAILTIAGLAFNLSYNNYQANKLIIDKCFENFDHVDEVVVKKNGFWSPVVCIKK